MNLEDVRVKLKKNPTDVVLLVMTSWSHGGSEFTQVVEEAGQSAEKMVVCVLLNT